MIDNVFHTWHVKVVVGAGEIHSGRTCVFHRLGMVSRANADHVQGTLLDVPV